MTQRPDPYALLTKAERAAAQAKTRHRAKLHAVADQQARRTTALRKDLMNLVTDVRAGVPRSKLSDAITDIMERLDA